jgi:hypothetical protein
LIGSNSSLALSLQDVSQGDFRLPLLVNRLFGRDSSFVGDIAEAAMGSLSDRVFNLRHTVTRGADCLISPGCIAVVVAQERLHALAFHARRNRTKMDGRHFLDPALSIGKMGHLRRIWPQMLPQMGVLNLRPSGPHCGQLFTAVPRSILFAEAIRPDFARGQKDMDMEIALVTAAVRLVHGDVGDHASTDELLPDKFPNQGLSLLKIQFMWQ